jgi:hypothetical protein
VALSALAFVTLGVVGLTCKVVEGRVAPRAKLRWTLSPNPWGTMSIPLIRFDFMYVSAFSLALTILILNAFVEFTALMKATEISEPSLF